jgi:hypothetical protein
VYLETGAGLCLPPNLRIALGIHNEFDFPDFPDESYEYTQAQVPACDTEPAGCGAETPEKPDQRSQPAFLIPGLSDVCYFSGQSNHS